MRQIDLDIINNVKTLIRQKGIKYRVLAEDLKVTTSAVSQCFSPDPKKRIPDAWLDTIAKRLEVSVSKLQSMHLDTALGNRFSESEFVYNVKSKSTINSRIKQCIDHFMKEKNINRQYTVAEILNIQPPTLSQILSGDTSVSVETLVRICNLNNYSADFIINGIGSMQVSSNISIERELTSVNNQLNEIKQQVKQKDEIILNYIKKSKKQ